jgi:hypothetical protein
LKKGFVRAKWFSSAEVNLRKLGFNGFEDLRARNKRIALILKLVA